MAATESTAARLVNWVLGVGSVVTGGLLLWIGSTTHQLATQQAVTADRVQQVQTQQVETTRSLNSNTQSLSNMSLRLQRVEDRIDLAREPPEE
jgi:hypothetical protein